MSILFYLADLKSTELHVSTAALDFSSDLRPSLVVSIYNVYKVRVPRQVTCESGLVNE